MENDATYADATTSAASAAKPFAKYPVCAAAYAAVCDAAAYATFAALDTAYAVALDTAYAAAQRAEGRAVHPFARDDDRAYQYSELLDFAARAHGTYTASGQARRAASAAQATFVERCANAAHAARCADSTFATARAIADDPAYDARGASIARAAALAAFIKARAEYYALVATPLETWK